MRALWRRPTGVHTEPCFGTATSVPLNGFGRQHAPPACFLLRSAALRARWFSVCYQDGALQVGENLPGNSPPVTPGWGQAPLLRAPGLRQQCPRVADTWCGARLKPTRSPEPHGKEQGNVLQYFYVWVLLPQPKPGLHLKPLSLWHPRFPLLGNSVSAPLETPTARFCSFPGFCHFVGEGSKLVRVSVHFAIPSSTRPWLLAPPPRSLWEIAMLLIFR